MRYFCFLYLSMITKNAKPNNSSYTKGWLEMWRHFVFLVNSLAGMGLYLTWGISFWTVVSIAIAKSVVFTSFLYFGTGWIVKLMKKRQILRRVFFYWEIAWDYLNNSNSKPGRHIVKKILHWLKKERQCIVFVASFVPIVPILPHATIVAFRLMRVRWGLPILFLGIIFKSIISCWILSQAVPYP